MRALHQVFAVPALIAALSVFGLVSALLADGLWDMLSWLSLGSTVVVALRYGALRQHPLMHPASFRTSGATAMPSSNPTTPR